jgi:release factor glutamine methyltransferase
MPTVLELINLSTDYLKNKGIDSPRINAELLLAKVLNCKRLDLYLSFDRPLVETELTLYRDFIKRRSKNEPLQYIVGSVEFYGLEFIVNRSVLIPRQETEILVETIITANKGRENLKILDVGTGSGIIAICLAKHLNLAHVVAVDYSADALVVAKENAIVNGVAENINFVQHDIKIDGINFGDDFDIIVSNPPYVSNEEFPKLQPELRIFEPKIALTDDSDGFSFYKTITQKASKLLKTSGKIYFEVGQGQYSQVEEILKLENFNNINIYKDYLNIERVIYGELN